MFERIKNLMERLRRKREISAEDFFKKYTEHTPRLFVSLWERMMEQLEEEGREAERKQILEEIEEIRIYDGSVIPKMAEQILKYKEQKMKKELMHWSSL